jgi:hypothetical protein
MKKRNIVASIYIESPKELQLSVNGERLKDYEFVFNAMYYEKISAAVGHDKWGVWFKQISELIPRFVVDIFPEKPNDYAIIYNVIRANMPTDSMEFELMAPYWDYSRFIEETTDKQSPAQ